MASRKKTAKKPLNRSKIAKKAWVTRRANAAAKQAAAV